MAANPIVQFVQTTSKQIMEHPLSHDELRELYQRPTHPDKIDSEGDDFIYLSKMSNEEDSEFFHSVLTYYTNKGFEPLEIMAKAFTALADTEIMYIIINEELNK